MTFVTDELANPGRRHILKSRGVAKGQEIREAVPQTSEIRRDRVFFSRNKNLVGLDIGSSSIKV
ncbi:MAG: hypothetical protein L0Z52_07150, partial [Acidobacteria bacterium]|nr:hypothetical protein [Acidobacteriota bacterium]